MSDEEEYSEEEEEEEEEEVVEKKPEVKKPAKVEEAPPKTEAELILEEKFNKKKNVDDDQWAEYIEQWRRQRQKEEDELKVLKDKQKKRRAMRGEEEQSMIEKKKQEEEQRVREIEEKKMRDIEEKKRRLEEVERKRQAMMDAMKKNEAEQKPNFVVQKRTDGGPGAAVGGSAMDKMLNVTAAKADLGKTKEQLSEDKNIALSFRVTPLEIEGMGLDQLKEKAQQLWELIVKLETEKYDLEERQKRQDYDLKELSERQRQINRNRALKKGLDPEALSGKHPPKIQVASKYERRIDRRSYDDKKNLFSGGNEAQSEAVIEKIWQDRFMEFSSRKGKVPEWMPGVPPSKSLGALDEEEPEQAEEEEEEE